MEPRLPRPFNSHTRDRDGVLYFPDFIFTPDSGTVLRLRSTRISALFYTETDVMDLIQDKCAGGLVFYQSRLLILERFNKVWLFPKGHIDPGETAPEAAIREVREECGLTARILAEMGETSYSFLEKEQEHFKTVQWFLMEGISGEIAFEKDFFTAVDLITEAELGRLTFEIDRELARKAFKSTKILKPSD